MGGAGGRTEQYDDSETVVWMSDDKTKACLNCHRKFALLRRKVKL